MEDRKKLQERLEEVRSEYIMSVQVHDFVNADVCDVHRSAYSASERSLFLVELAIKELDKAIERLNKPPRGA